MRITEGRSRAFSAWTLRSLVVFALLGPLFGSIPAQAARRPAATVRKIALPGTPALRPTRPRTEELPALVKLALEFPDLRDRGEADRATSALLGLRGVSCAIVDARTRLAVVDYNPRDTGLAAITETCRTAGLAVREYRVEDRFPKPIKLKGG